MPGTQLIVSDFHMGSGHRDGELNPWESFVYDDRFAEFLHHHSSGPYRDTDVELILNGDIFDFLQVPVDGRFPLRITEAIAVRKLKSCMDGHPEVIGALATFLTMRGKTMTILPGNHDFEWVFPKVQEAFCLRLTGATSNPRIRVITDRPTYEFDGIQVQHGQQLDMPHFHNFKEKFLIRRGQAVLNLPWGSQYLLSVMTKLKEQRPYLDRVRPFKAYLIRAIIFDPWFFVRVVLLSVIHFLKTRVFNLRDFGARMRQNWRLLVETDPYPDLFGKVRHILADRPELHTVILGHTHVALVRRLRDGRQYVNGGCWTETVSFGLGSFGHRSKPTYVLVETPEGATKPVVKLRQWNGMRHPFEELRY